MSETGKSKYAKPTACSVPMYAFANFVAKSLSLPSVFSTKTTCSANLKMPGVSPRPSGDGTSRSASLSEVVAS